MDIKIDWLSFTVPTVGATEGQGDETQALMLAWLDRYTDGLLIPVIGWHRRQVNKGSGFYHTVIVDEDTKARLSWGNVNAHIYVEINGVACEQLRSAGVLNDILQKVSLRASRVDLAGDCECDLQPKQVIGNYYKESGKSYSEIVSSDGETVYVGSRKSERFLRVYRYRHPHPRSHLLRIEHEFKGDMAKRFLSTMLNIGIVETFSLACNNYHWDNESWKSGEWTEGKLKAKHSDREGASTLLWLEEAVKPALKRVHTDGLLDCIEWLKNLMQDIEKGE